LNEEAKAILRLLLNRQMERGRCAEWVFPSENPTRHLDEDNFYGRVFLPAVRAAKLEGVTWHTLRHTFASRLAMSGQNASTIAELLRHSGLDLVRRYAHLSPTHLKAAVESVASFGTVIKPGMEEGETLKSGRGERI
jgi:site-specific recombinase XerD